MQISQDAAVFRLPVHQADLHRCRSLANLFSEIFTEVRDSSGLSGPRVPGSPGPRVLESSGPWVPGPQVPGSTVYSYPRKR